MLSIVVCWFIDLGCADPFDADVFVWFLGLGVHQRRTTWCRCMVFIVAEPSPNIAGSFTGILAPAFYLLRTEMTNGDASCRGFVVKAAPNQAPKHTVPVNEITVRMKDERPDTHQNDNHVCELHKRARDGVRERRMAGAVKRGSVQGGEGGGKYAVDTCSNRHMATMKKGRHSNAIPPEEG